MARRGDRIIIIKKKTSHRQVEVQPTSKVSTIKLYHFFCSHRALASVNVLKRGRRDKGVGGGVEGGVSRLIDKILEFKRVKFER